jgi:hypothetical protein
MHRPTAAAAAAVVAARLYSLRATALAGGVHRLCIVVQYCCSGCSHMLLCCCTYSRVDLYSWIDTIGYTLPGDQALFSTGYAVWWLADEFGHQ